MFDSLLYFLFDLFYRLLIMMKLKGAAVTAFAGLRLCLVAYGLPDSGGPAEPTEETAD